jgi:hypothetical protein
MKVGRPARWLGINGTQVARTRPSRSRREARARREAQIVGAVGLLGAAALPIVLWHHAIGVVASDFRIELEYLVTGWTAWVLICLGIALMLPVVISIGRNPESRLYPRARNAYAGWGISLYLLGLMLASQVAQISRGLAVP